MESVTDEDLMLRYGAGDADAFAPLYERHKAPLYRYVLRQVQPAATAEEVFQDVWMNVVRVRATYQVRAKFTTWLYRLAHNRIVDHYRRSKTNAAQASMDDDDALLEQIPQNELLEPENELDRRRMARQLLELLQSLPPVQREAFVLREEGGLTVEEIAVVTGVNMETAKSRLRYALAKLRQALIQERNDLQARTRDGHKT
jgi:RNA polymerase sigma factor (sigma-70 family)